MWSQFTAAARAALRSGSQFQRSRIDVWHSGLPVFTLNTVISGGVTADADDTVRRSLACAVVDDTGTLTRDDVNDLLSPYDCEVAAYRGVSVGSTVEWAPHGVFRLTGRTVRDTPDGLVISMVGQDRSMMYQVPMDSPHTINAGTSIEDAIASLLARCNAGLVMQSMVTGFTCGPLFYKPDIDVWEQARKLAQSVGASLFHDRTGRCVLASAGPASDNPVATFSEGDGLLQEVSRKEDADTIHNVVRAESASGAVFAIAEDTDPTSPTYARGIYGRHPTTITNQHIASPDQALIAATAALSYELGRSETVTFDAVPDPAQDVQEVVTVNRPRSGLVKRALTVATLEMPLGVEDLMRVGCRRNVLAPDGEVLAVTSL